MYPASIKLRSRVVWHLPRTLIGGLEAPSGNPTEPWVMIYGRCEGERYVASSVHNCEADRKENSVTLQQGVRKKLLGYDEALAANNGAGYKTRRNGETKLIGHAHAHNRRKFLPLLGDKDIEVARKEMESRDMEWWIEIVLWYKTIDPEGIRKYLPEKDRGIVYKMDEGRPRIKIFHEESNLGLDITYCALFLNRDDRIQREAKARFDRRAFRKIALML